MTYLTSSNRPAGAENVCAVLVRRIDDLDLPPSLHDVAEQQYDQVGQFLANQPGGPGWDVYPQGSFRLGTVVRPLAGEFDLDMVCRLEVGKDDVSKKDLKRAVGEALGQYMEAHRGVPGSPYEYVESRRCWTLHYEAEFHMDVLPAIPNVDTPPSGILLTDKNLLKWQHSDPIKYADWFHERKGQEFLRRKAVLAAEARKSVGEFPDWMVKTTLQRVVQLLKSHRDLYFKDALDDRPPSILITTLAAQAYEGGDDLFTAVLQAVAKMPDFIELGMTGPRVMSPVADENFADKWREYPARHRAFTAWLTQVGVDLDEAARQGTPEGMVARLGDGFGAEQIRKAAMAVREEAKTVYRGARPALGVVASTRPSGTGRHPAAAPREQYISERFPIQRTHAVEITCDVTEPTYPNRAARRWALKSAGGKVDKQRELLFRVTRTDVPEPFQLFWKVRNHGAEAERVDGLRGELMPDDGTRQRKESTLYTGFHYMECYIVKNGVCVAIAHEDVRIA
jgi:hypothetical protein